MIIKKNIILCFLSINGQEHRLTIAKKDGFYCAYTDGGRLLCKTKTYKAMIDALDAYETTNQ